MPIVFVRHAISHLSFMVLLPIALQLSYATPAAAQDQDGDGVSDSQETLDGSDPLDRGSNLVRPGIDANGDPAALCAEWNSFLGESGRLWNILEHINADNDELGISTVQKDLDGQTLRTLQFSVAGGAQQDLLVHDLGHPADSYGQVCSLAARPALDATMVYYKPAPQPSSRQFQFAVAMQLGSERLGEQYVPINTYDIDNMGRPVANWVTVANAEESSQSGTIIFYETDGSIIGTTRVTLAGGQRRDYSGHAVGLNHVGMARFIPDSAAARFRVRNARYLFDNTAWLNSFASAVSIDGLVGSGRELVAPLDTRGQWAIVEIGNTTGQMLSVSGQILTAAGAVAHTFGYQLAPYASIHPITNEFLPEQRGLVKLQGAVRGSTIAVAMHYRRNAVNGVLQYLYAVPAVEALGSSLFTSFNTYLEQQPRAVLLNATDKAQGAVYSLTRSDGTILVLNQRVTVPASGALELDLTVLAGEDIYGVISIAPDARNSLIAWVERVRPEEFVLVTRGRQPPLAEPPSGGSSRMILQSFDGSAPPVNKDGDGYPTFYDGGSEGGIFTTSIHPTDAVSGTSLRMQLTQGALYAQFNPYGYNVGVQREFARDYCADPSAWKYNTYNRLRFWLKRPTSAVPHATDGTSNMNVGTYVKRVNNPDSTSDEEGGGHYYHKLNVPASGTWSQVILNMHPDHLRGNPGGLELPNLPHPTGETSYNYYDALTRFYIQDDNNTQAHPADFLLDEIELYRELNVENDDQIRSITATYIAAENRVIVTWFRNKDENDVVHEVRYAFSSIHQRKWEDAQPAPGGNIVPPGFQGYNGMTYETTALPLSGQAAVYVAIKPENSDLFSEVRIPLTLD